MLTRQHTLTCELRRVSPSSTASMYAGNIRLRASCDPRWPCWPANDSLATYAYVRVATFPDMQVSSLLVLATYAYVRVATGPTMPSTPSLYLATYAYVRVATPKRSISLSSHTSFHMRMDFSTKRLLEFGFGFPKANPHWPLFPPSFSAPLLRFRSSGIRQIGTCPAPLKFPDRPYPVCNYQTPKLAGCRFPSLRMVSIARSCMYLKRSKVWLHCSRSTPFISALLFISKNAEYISLWTLVPSERTVQRSPSFFEW